MNIYALKGHKVKAVDTTPGYHYQIQRAEKYLKIGKVYTVEYTEVHSESTDVVLQEIPGVEFNSTCFEDLRPQAEKDDRKHEDYARWND